MTSRSRCVRPPAAYPTAVRGWTARLRIQSLEALQRLDVVGDAARTEHAAHHAAGHQRVGCEQQALVLLKQRDAGRGVARGVHHVETEIAEVDQIAFLEPDVDIDRNVRLVEHFSQHREIVAQHDLVGGEAMGGDEGAALVEAPGVLIRSRCSWLSTTMSIFSGGHSAKFRHSTIAG